MTEVEKFFRRLVSTLAASSPARLQGPLLLDDITGSILPYRTHRRALELDTVEDYEGVLLRLCAGEGDLVWTEPEDARKRFVAESRSNNPDLTALYAFENVYLSFQPEPLLWALAPDPRADYAPPAPPLEASLPEPEPPEPEVVEESVLVLGTAQLEMSPRPEESDPALADEMVEAAEPPTAQLPVLRRITPLQPHGQLLPPLRAEPDPDPLSRVPQRGRARLAALRQLRRRGW